MKAFRCRVCDKPLHFENSRCVSCDSRLGFSRSERAIVPVDEKGRYVDADGLEWFLCRNLTLSGLHLADRRATAVSASAAGSPAPGPTTTTPIGLANYPAAERAKRHLVVELDGLGFPIVGKDTDPDNGLAFDLLSSVEENVTIGHANGLITIDLAESSAAHREQVREKLGEPYRTMLGHFRHEVGHYYEWQLVKGELRTRYRELFGDESADYQGEIDRHYAEGPPAGWESSYISSYATMHPFEDFAETWAHYLHICDSIETASEYGLTTVGTITSFTSFRDVVVGIWMPLSVALNMINRSMGHEDLYPFVIPAAVLDKLDFVASLARRD